MYFIRRDDYVANGAGSWVAFTQNNLLLWTLLMLPLFVTLEAALMGNLEHGNGGFKQLFALPVPRWSLYTAKLVTNLGMFLISTFAMCVFIVGTGLLLQILEPRFLFNQPIPVLHILQLAGLSYLGSWLIIAFHTWVSLRWDNFVVAIATGAAATVAAVLIVQSEYLGYYPWTIPAALAMPNTDGVVVPTLSLGISLAGASVTGCLRLLERSASRRFVISAVECGLGRGVCPALCLTGYHPLLSLKEDPLALHSVILTPRTSLEATFAVKFVVVDGRVMIAQTCRADECKGTGMLIDFHTHIFPPEIREKRTLYWQRSAWFSELYSQKKAKLATAEDLIAEMDASGVAVSVACGFPWDDAEICRFCNDYLIDVAARYPGRIIGLASVQPTDPEAAALEAERCIKAGMRGVGELNPDGQGFDLRNHEALAPLVRVLEANNAVMMLHTNEIVGHYYPGKGKTGPDTVYRFAEHFPGLKIVASHWGGGLLFYELMPEVHKALANVYYDTAASCFLYRPEVFQAAISLVDSKKVLHGTDYPLVRQTRILKQIKALNLPARG